MGLRLRTVNSVPRVGRHHWLLLLGLLVAAFGPTTADARSDEACESAPAETAQP